MADCQKEFFWILFWYDGINVGGKEKSIGVGKSGKTWAVVGNLFQTWELKLHFLKLGSFQTPFHVLISPRYMLFWELTIFYKITELTVPGRDDVGNRESYLGFLLAQLFESLFKLCIDNHR